MQRSTAVLKFTIEEEKGKRWNRHRKEFGDKESSWKSVAIRI
jgi:hypothetical protein